MRSYRSVTDAAKHNRLGSVGDRTAPWLAPGAVGDTARLYRRARSCDYTYRGGDVSFVLSRERLWEPRARVR
jgi:hypothetical protein